MYGQWNLKFQVLFGGLGTYHLTNEQEMLNFLDPLIF